MNPVRIAVIGGGHLGRIHCRLLAQQKEAELIGVVDPRASARDGIAAELGIPAFAAIDELPRAAEAAVVATPTCVHFPIARELLEQGTHLLVEKPLAANLAEADALIVAAERRGVVLAVGHTERFNPAFEVAASQLRRPRYIEAVRTGPYTGRSTDVGAVLDLMIHDIELVLALVDSCVTRIEAVGSAVIGPHEDLAQARLTFSDGCVANLMASRVCAEPQRTMKVYAADAHLQIDFGERTAQIVRPSRRILQGDFHFAALSADQKSRFCQQLFEEHLRRERLSVPPRNALLEEQADFLASIRFAGTPRVTARQGRAALAVAEQVLEDIAARGSWSSREPAVPEILPWNPQRRAG